MTKKTKIRAATAAAITGLLFGSYVSAMNATSSDAVGMQLWWGVMAGGSLVLVMLCLISYAVSLVEGFLND